MMMPKLKDPALFREHAYIDGAWLAADASETLEIRNPASAEILGTVPPAPRYRPGVRARPANAARSCVVGTN
jgi:acyl-CoA reductase-like NAD-dependent aldehyde dehydrogenase